MEKVSDRQLAGVIALVIISGILMSGGSDRSMQNSWIAAAVAVVAMAPVFLVYARITSLFPGKGLYEITKRVFGSVFGKVLIFLFCIYAFFAGAMAMRFFSEFNRVVSMPETSQILTLIAFGTACIYIMKKGVGTLGGFSNLALPLILFIIVIINILSLPDWKLHHIMPVMYKPGKNFFGDIFTTAVFPIGEAVLICTIFGFKKEKKNFNKIFLYGLVVGGVLLVLETLRSIAVLGANTISLLYYPSYTAAGTINIMDFFTRIEVAVSASFLVAQIVKVCLCIYAFSGGVGEIFGARDYKSLVTPTVFAMIAMASILFKNTVESYEFLEVYKIYALLFQIILPLIIWIGTEIAAGKEKRLMAE